MAVRLVAALLLVVVCALLVPAPAMAAAHHVMIMNFTFSTVTVTARVGDTITWTNHDDAPHDVVTSGGPVAFRSPMLQKGQSYTHTITAPGNYAYYCGVHPDMRAQIVVRAPDTPAPAPPTPAPVQRQPVTQQPAATTTTTTAAPAPAGPVEQQPEVPAPAQDVRAAQVVGQRLDPMLIVAGVVGAVAVLCLLLIGARPEP